MCVLSFGGVKMVGWGQKDGSQPKGILKGVKGWRRHTHTHTPHAHAQTHKHTDSIISWMDHHEPNEADEVGRLPSPPLTHKHARM